MEAYRLSAGREEADAEALPPEPTAMAEVILKNIKKVYPRMEPKKKKKGTEGLFWL